MKESRNILQAIIIEIADDLLKYRKKKILKNPGKVSHEEAISKANQEYEKYKLKQEETYISSMDKMLNKYLEESKG